MLIISLADHEPIPENTHLDPQRPRSLLGGGDEMKRANAARQRLQPYYTLNRRFFGAVRVVDISVKQSRLALVAEIIGGPLGNIEGPSVITG